MGNLFWNVLQACMFETCQNLSQSALLPTEHLLVMGLMVWSFINFCKVWQVAQPLATDFFLKCVFVTAVIHYSKGAIFQQCHSLEVITRMCHLCVLKFVSRTIKLRTICMARTRLMIKSGYFVKVTTQYKMATDDMALKSTLFRYWNADPVLKIML